jgi:UDP:flavonoid glycosyltransferase YjiC (YdhE family)
MPEKPVILIFPFDLMSHFFRSLRVAIALKDHYEVYMNGSGKYDDWLEKAGIKSFSCLQLDAENALEKIGEFDFSWLNADALESVYLDQVRTIREYKPTLVIGDTSFSLKMAAEASGVRYLSVLNAYSTRYYRHTRRLSPRHRAAPLIGWLPDIFYLPMVRMGEAWNFSQILKEFNKVRAKYKLSLTPHYLEELAGDLNILCDLPEIFPQKKLPDNFHFIGPLFCAFDLANGSLLDKLEPEKQTILLTLGSSTDWEHFTFINREEFSAFNVIIVGEKSEILDAPFLLKTQFVNYDKVLPEVDLVICHGGNGTLYHALKNKVPVLCLEAHLEQTWNIHRMEELGYGQALDTRNPAHIHQLVLKWLGKKSVISWDLNFSSYNEQVQNELLLKIVSGPDPLPASR